MVVVIKSRGRRGCGGHGAVGAIVCVPEPPPCSCRRPWAFQAGAGDGCGDRAVEGAEREKLLWRPLRAPKPLTGPSSRGRCSPRRGSWSSGATLGWAGCLGWSCWKLWSALGNLSPLRQSPWLGRHFPGPCLRKTRSPLTGKAWAATLHCSFLQRILSLMHCRSVQRTSLTGRCWRSWSGRAQGGIW